MNKYNIETTKEIQDRTEKLQSEMNAFISAASLDIGVTPYSYESLQIVWTLHKLAEISLKLDSIALAITQK